MSNGADAAWRKAGSPVSDRVYLRCANFSLGPQCNWLVPQEGGAHHPLCRCCRLNRTVPDAGVAENAALWHKVELAKRRLVSSLIALGLPVASRLGEDTQRGLSFDLSAQAAEAIRTALREPYRTVLGHVRHESGHYYWSGLRRTK